MSEKTGERKQCERKPVHGNSHGQKPLERKPHEQKPHKQKPRE